MHAPNTPSQPGQYRPLCDVIITSCSAAPPGNCSSPHKFLCDTGLCLPISYRCDGHNNCEDSTDEKNCCKLMVIVTVVLVVVQSNTLKSNVLGNFFFLRVLRFLWLTRPRRTSLTLQSSVLRRVYVPCIYMHVRWVTAGDSGLFCRACMSLEPPCVLMLQKVLRVKFFVCLLFCFFALQNDDSWYWTYFLLLFCLLSVSVASDTIFGAAKLQFLMAS